MSSSNPTNSSATAHQGSTHWRMQRISAIVLIPLTLWFVFSVIDHIGDDHQTIMLWVSQPLVTFALVIFLATMFYHAQLGLQVVLEDYVHNESLRSKALWCVRGVAVVAGLLTVLSVLRVAL